MLRLKPYTFFSESCIDHSFTGPKSAPSLLKAAVHFDFTVKSDIFNLRNNAAECSTTPLNENLKVQ
jgi:hypothetical protein